MSRAPATPSHVVVAGAVTVAIDEQVVDAIAVLVHEVIADIIAIGINIQRAASALSAPLGECKTTHKSDTTDHGQSRATVFL